METRRWLALAMAPWRGQGRRGLASASRRERYPAIGGGLKPTVSLGAFSRRFQRLENGERLTQSRERFVVCGRVASKPREASKKLFFMPIRSGADKLQVLCDAKHWEDEETPLAEVLREVNEGDAVAVRGFPGKSRSGEVSLVAADVRVLSPCRRDVPSGRGDGKFALRDSELRARQRHVDLLANAPAALEPFVARAKAVGALRRELEKRDFLEVETPVMSASGGGALAEPFVTQARALGGRELSLRVAPELWLKRLVVGGVDRVFEIGKVFRNEGVSTVHHPEFSTCELYMAYADCDDVMALTEELLPAMARAATGGTDLPGGVSLEPPFRRVSVVKELERVYDLPEGGLPDVNDGERAEEVREELVALLLERQSVARQPLLDPALWENDAASVAGNCRLLDEMISREIEPHCQQPTFVCDHPLAMAPLAKARADAPGLAHRFELFIRGREVVNAYSELNDPEEQLERFRAQLAGRPAHQQSRTDLEVMPVDADYCAALEYGLPPTAGWGIGLDRFVMLLTGRTSIREVLFFPLMASPARPPSDQ